MNGSGDAELWRVLEAVADAAAGRPALRVDDQEWTLAELLEEAAGIAEWLVAAGAGAPLFLRPRSSLCSVACLLGAIRAGAVPALADVAWTEAELGSAMERCGARHLLCEGGDATGPGETVAARDRGQLKLLRAGPDAATAPPPGAAFGRFTSGTTGAPRCLAFGQAAALAAGRGWAAAAGYEPGEEILCLATLNNGLGFNASLLPALLSGACLNLHFGRLVRSSVRRALDGLRPTVLVAFPFVFEQLVRGGITDTAQRRLRLAISSAAQLDEQVKDAWRELGGPPICDYYGVAEVGPCTFNEDGFPGSLGRALPAVHLKIVDERGEPSAAESVGRVRVKTPSAALDFLDSEQPRFAASFDQDGYFIGKDLGRLDSEGRLFLHGRVGRQVNIAGRKIEPSEVEAVLGELAGVRAAVVVAQPAGADNVLAAYLEGDAIDRETVVAHCQKRLAAYKIPQAIHLVAELPRSSTGKVSVGALVDRGEAGRR